LLGQVLLHHIGSPVVRDAQHLQRLAGTGSEQLLHMLVVALAEATSGGKEDDDGGPLLGDWRF